MKQLNIYDFLGDTQTADAQRVFQADLPSQHTNQRNIMNNITNSDLLELINQLQAIVEEPESTDEQDECTECTLERLNELESILLANNNIHILEVINNTLMQEAPIRNEQADTLLKLAQLRVLLLEH